MAHLTSGEMASLMDTSNAHRLMNKMEFENGWEKRTTSYRHHPLLWKYHSSQGVQVFLYSFGKCKVVCWDILGVFFLIAVNPTHAGQVERNSESHRRL